MHIGHGGVGDAVIREVDRALDAHELIKVRAGGADRVSRATLLAAICARTDATPVQSVGKVMVLWRPRSVDRDAPRRAPDEVSLSVRQFSAAWRLMCVDGPGHALAASAGIEYIFSGLPIGFFNVGLLTERRVSDDRLRSLGRDACTWASDKGVPWMFVVTHDALEAGTDAAAVLDGCGLAPVMPLTGMLAQHLSPAARIPDDLHLAVPQDDAGCSAILDVNAAAYSMDLDAAKALVGTRSFWKDHVAVLGRAADTPACSATVLMVDGYRYVALVATDPAHQRRGFADAAMRRALEIASETHGERPTVLHATDAGRPVYERMGYAAISTHTIFMEKRFLADH